MDNNEVQIGDTVRAYESGYHTYLGPAHYWLPDKEQFEAFKARHIKDQRSRRIGEDAQNTNIAYYSDPKNFAVEGPEGGYCTATWGANRFRLEGNEEEGITEYYLGDIKPGDGVYYKRFLSSKLTKSVGQMKKCSKLYIQKVDLEKERDKAINKIKNA